MVADQKSAPEKPYSALMEKMEIVENHGPKFGVRHVQVLLALLVIIMNYAVRISMSVIIVAMTDPNASPNKDIPTYNWTDKSLIMTGFIWGYMIPQIGAGYLATVFGGKWLLVGSLVFSSASGFLIPIVAATVGSKGVLGMRIIQGISQGFMFPSIHAFLGKWVPLQERSRLGSLPYLGSAFGTIASMLLTGMIASSSYGWTAAIYIYCSVSFLTAIILAFFGASSPDDHSSITEEEKSYIKNNLGGGDSERKEDIPVPWSDILTSLPFWALISAQASFSWGNWTLLFETPIYMNRVMKFDLKSNGFLSSLPYVADAMTSMIYSVIADFFIVKNIFSVRTTRKIANSYGTLMPAICMFLVAHCKSDDAYMALGLLIVIGATQSAVRSGYNVNHMDLSPNFAGVLMGISNGLSSAISSFGPVVVQFYVTNEEDPQQWKSIFYLAGFISIFGVVFFNFCGSGEVQPWNEGGKRFKERYRAVPLKV